MARRVGEPLLARASTRSIPNGVLIPDAGRRREPRAPDRRSSAGTSRARACHVLLRAWPEMRRRTGARLRLIGADPLAVRLVLTRNALPTTESTCSASSPRTTLTAELLTREGARRPLARRRELRDGADAGLRLRDAGRRLGHRRLPRRHGAETADCSCRPATRLRSPTRSPDCSTTRSARQRSAAPLAAIARRALLVGPDRRRGSTRSTSLSSRRGRSPREAASHARGGRLALMLPFAVAVAVLLVWRGPEWDLVARRLPPVSWRWVVAGGRAQPPLGRRARARLAHRDRAGDASAAARASARSSRRSASACSRTPCCPAGSASSRASRS